MAVVQTFHPIVLASLRRIDILEIKEEGEKRDCSKEEGLLLQVLSFPEYSRRPLYRIKFYQVEGLKHVYRSLKKRERLKD